MKLSLKNAALILLAGLLVLAAGSALNNAQARISNPVMLGGLAIEFIGTIWLVLSLNQRRRKHRL